jgi:hypothetical protein
MSRSRRALLVRMIEKERQDKSPFVPLPAWLWDAMPAADRAKWPAAFVEAQTAAMAQQAEGLRRLQARVPRPLGNEAKTLAARAAVQAAKSSRPTKLLELVHWTRCPSCGAAASVPGGSETTTTCPRCRAGV